MLVAISSLAGIAISAEPGDSGERSLAEDVKEAFTNGKAVDMFEYFTPEKQTEEIRLFDSSIQTLKDSEKTERDAAIEDFNDAMWWDVDWQKVREVADFDKFGEMDKIKFQLRKFREYASPDRVKDFEYRINDLRLVVYRRTHDAGLDDWGNATIEFANKWNDRISIDMVQRSGEWFVSDMKVTGFPLQTMEQTEKAREARKK